MRMAPRTRVARKVAALIAAAPFVLAPIAFGTSAAALPAQEPTNVDATLENKFIPEVLTVPVGATVTWTNKGPGIHTVTGGDGQLDPNSPIGDNMLQTDGQTVQKTFDTAGTFPYFCTPHLALGMKGQIVVVDAAAAGGGASPAAGGASPAAGGSAAPSGGAASPGQGNTVGGSAAPAAAPGGPEGGGPAGAPAAGGESVAPGAPAQGAPGASVGAATGAPASADPNLGEEATEVLETQLANEREPLTSFRLALTAVLVGVTLVSAAIFFITRPSRDEI